MRGHKVGPTTAAAPTFPSAEQCSARAAQQSRAPQQSSREAAGQCGIPAAAAARHNLGKKSARPITPCLVHIVQIFSCLRKVLGRAGQRKQVKSADVQKSVQIDDYLLLSITRTRVHKAVFYFSFLIAFMDA